jgi:exodeoxyribonuclease VII large subunit
VVTSPTGAVIRDVISVLRRRFPNMAVEITPVKVQGEGAAEEIAEALRMLNDRADADVVVIARGGGSLEDLQAFNSEVVARAVFSSRIPVVSAVGHETDFTIADFVADMRAPTPSAAAELIAPVKEELLAYIAAVRAALKNAVVQRLRLLAEQTTHISQRLVHPARRLADHRLALDDRVSRILTGLTRTLTDKRRHLDAIADRLSYGSPQIMAHEYDILLKHSIQSLSNKMQFYIEAQKGKFRSATASLHALSPLAVLERGYSVTRALPGYAIVRDVQQIDVGQQVEVTVSRGAMVCRIERKTRDGQTNI